MNRNWKNVAYAGVLAVSGIACAGRQQTENPTAQAVQAQQRQSQQALDRANEAQKRASDQERKATQAQEDVQKAQQALIKARQNASREQAKAEQMQREANAMTAQAARQASQSQQRAMQSLAQQGQQVQQGRLTTAGQLVAASGDELVLQPRSGQQPMTFRVTDQTDVRLDGQRASLADLQQGEDVRVSYQTSGSTQPQALTVEASRTGTLPAPGAGPQGALPPAEGGGAQGTIPPAEGTGSQDTTPPQGTGSQDTTSPPQGAEPPPAQQ